MKSGFVAIVGKPNVGKSTLVNALVGQKVSITTSKPQTTRHRVMGVVHGGEDFQLVLVDTPGYMKPKHLLGERMVQQIQSEQSEADVVLWVVEPTHNPGSEDVFIADMLSSSRLPIALVFNKLDKRKDEASWEERKENFRQLLSPTIEFEVSAAQNIGLNDLQNWLVDRMPEGPPYFPPEMASDQNRNLIISEVIREKALMLSRKEVPHSLAVVVDLVEPGKNKKDLLVVHATILVERNSQKGIIVGAKGSKLKSIGSQARTDLEELFGHPFFLQLWVKVKPDWRERADVLRTLGFESDY